MFKSLIPSSIKFKQIKGSLTSDELSVPGYVYEEAIKTTFNSRNDCCELFEFTLSTLNEVNLPVQKLKVLKMLKCLVERGDPFFMEMLSKRDRLIKEASRYNGPSDQSYGNMMSISVRNEAQELLQYIHSPSQSIKPLIVGNEICGMGSMKSSSGKYDGFGSAQVTNTNMFDRVLTGFSDLMNDLRKGGRENAIDVETQLKTVLQLSSGGYKRVKLSQTMTEAPFASKEPIDVQEKIKQRVVGRPGGGWDDDEYLEVSQALTKLEDTVICDASGEERESHAVPDEAEINFMTEILAKNGQFTSWKELDAYTDRCKMLNIEILMNLFSKNMHSEEDVNMKILQLIEVLFHADLISLSLFHNTVKTLIEDLSKNSSAAINRKANKINLIIEKHLAIAS